jgi:hypothetical protein
MIASLVAYTIIISLLYHSSALCVIYKVIKYMKEKRLEIKFVYICYVYIIKDIQV